MLLRGIVAKLPYAFATVAGIEFIDAIGLADFVHWVRMIPGVGLFIAHGDFFSTIAIAIFLDTALGIRAALRRGEKFHFKTMLSGVMSKVGEYWFVMLVAIKAQQTMEGELFFDDLVTFVRNGIFVGILYAEGDSAMKNAGLKIQRVFRGVLDAAAKRFPVINGNGNGKPKRNREDHEGMEHEK